jgi:XTP/dITP diphosphohydrolase
MKILLATSNPHKLDEICAILGGVGRELVSLGDLGLNIPEPVEDGDTFEANAVLKARYYANAADKVCMADDSGLEVDALRGQPGVYSARYAGADGPPEVVDPANNALLMQRLGDTPIEQRTARFVSAIALCAPGMEEPRHLVRGILEGRIVTSVEGARGDHGFGYDPLFMLPQRGLTTAQLSADEKNAISHRGCAARLLHQRLLDDG